MKTKQLIFKASLLSLAVAASAQAQVDQLENALADRTLADRLRQIDHRLERIGGEREERQTGGMGHDDLFA